MAAAGRKKKARREAEAWEAFMTLCRVIAYSCMYEIYVEHQTTDPRRLDAGKCSFCTEAHEFERAERAERAERVARAGSELRVALQTYRDATNEVDFAAPAKSGTT